MSPWLSRLLARHPATAHLPPNAVASLLMLLAFLCFAAMPLMTRAVGPSIPVVEMILVRQAVALVLMAPVYVRIRHQIRRPQRLDLHVFRGLMAIGSMGCGLTAVQIVPLADVTAIQMTEVLFATAFAALFLREVVTRRQWMAALVGFLGVLVMLQPFTSGLGVGGLIALASAIFGALSMIALRLGAAYDTVETVTFWQGLAVLVMILPFGLWFWVWPGPFEWLVLGGMSVVFTVGVWLFTAALRLGETAALAPLHYLRLILMAGLGWAIYGEVPTLATVAGAILVIGSAIVTLRDNAGKDKRVPPVA